MPDFEERPATRSNERGICSVCGGMFAAYGCGCLAALERFRALMESELRSNTDKGGRAQWRCDPAYVLLAEFHDHAAKLHLAARELERRNAGREPRPLPWGDRSPESLVREFAADTANMTLMLLDSFGLLDGGE